MRVEVVLPVKTVSEANTRSHWTARAKRAELQRGAARMATRGAVRGILPTIIPPIIVTLTRVALQKLDDDNLRGAFKGVRDGVADAIGVNDRDQRVTWRYAQKVAKKYAVVILVEYTTS